MSERILAAVAGGGTMREAEIADVCGVPRTAIRRTLARLGAEGPLERAGRGRYRLGSSLA